MKMLKYVIKSNLNEEKAINLERVGHQMSHLTFSTTKKGFFGPPKSRGKDDLP